MVTPARTVKSKTNQKTLATLTSPIFVRTTPFVNLNFQTTKNLTNGGANVKMAGKENTAPRKRLITCVIVQMDSLVNSVMINSLMRGALI